LTTGTAAGRGRTPKKDFFIKTPWYGEENVRKEGSSQGTFSQRKAILPIGTLKTLILPSQNYRAAEYSTKNEAVMSLNKVGKREKKGQKSLAELESRGR